VEQAVRPHVKGKDIAHQKSLKGALLVKSRVAAAAGRETAVQARAESLEYERGGGLVMFRYGTVGIMGRRLAMEDVCVCRSDCPRAGAATFALFDGHGGREAAEYAAANLPPAIAAEIAAGAADAIERAFARTQAEMAPWCTYVGTTALLAIFEGTTVTVANAGDTRCVIRTAGVARRLSVDHTPDVPEEARYVRENGGTVVNGRINNALAVSRGLGDGFLGKCQNPTPAVNVVQLSQEDDFMILACDGLWDVMTDQEACDLIHGSSDPQLAATTLAQTAYKLGSTDNISVIVIILREALADTAE
jgi:serine/threonine protein phosphatase PrpC